METIHTLCQNEINSEFYAKNRPHTIKTVSIIKREQQQQQKQQQQQQGQKYNIYA